MLRMSLVSITINFQNKLVCNIFTLWCLTNVSLGKANLLVNLYADIVSYHKKNKHFYSTKMSYSSPRLQASHRRVPPHTPPPSDTSHGHSHLSSLPYSLLRGQGRQADWLSTKKYFSVLSFFFSKVEPHPPQPQTKQVFYINPIATPRFQNTTSKVRLYQLHPPTHPACPPAHPPAPVCPHNTPSTLSDINNAMMFSRHSQSDR